MRNELNEIRRKKLYEKCMKVTYMWLAYLFHTCDIHEKWAKYLYVTY
jgi:hypothetical protein